jgi:hypothetical protein
LVGRIKDEFGIRFNGQACTVFDAVSALMWQCHTRATMSDPKPLRYFCFQLMCASMLLA